MHSTFSVYPSSFGSPMPGRGGVQKCSTVTTTTYTTTTLVNEDFNSGGVGGFTGPGGTSFTNVSNGLHVATLSGPPKATRAVTTVSGTTYTFNINITAIGTSSGTVRVRINSGAYVTYSAVGAIVPIVFTATSTSTTFEVGTSGALSGSFDIDNFTVTYVTSSTSNSTVCGALDGYKYGFNGQEKDNEYGGEGSTNTAEYWEYDSRLGRRWNLDPIFRAWESGYTCFADNPVMLNDPDGRNPEDPQKYTTTKGDNLSKIGKKYGVSVDNIVKWNNIKDKNKIGIGQSLIVSDPAKPAAQEKFETYPDFGPSTGYTTRNTNHATQTESTTASSGYGVGRASMGCYDVCNFKGDLLDAIKVDPAITSLENKLVAQAQANPAFGKYNFYFASQTVVGFGGQRWSNQNEAWSSASRQNPLLHKSTWEVAANTLTWVLRNATVMYFVEVNPQGAINIQFRVYDGLDLSPQKGRSEAYNNISTVLGFGYHTLGGGNKNMQTRASWNTIR